MNSHEIDEMLLAKGPAQGEVDRPVLDEIRRQILASVARVPPLPPTRVFAVAFLIAAGAIAVLGAALLGMPGVHLLTSVQRIAIFGSLSGIALLAAFATARDMRPGAGSVRGSVVFGAGLVVIEAVFLLLFHDYGMGRFMHSGLGCLRGGLLCAIPAGLLIWLLVKRGYIVEPVSTGAAIGATAGITGVTMLELHCPILTVPHVAIWHAAVLVVSVAVGALAGWLSQRASH